MALLVSKTVELREFDSGTSFGTKYLSKPLIWERIIGAEKLSH
jgi:hypothetical protein